MCQVRKNCTNEGKTRPTKVRMCGVYFAGIKPISKIIVMICVIAAV